MVNKEKKFTFKTIKPTGRYKSFDNPEHIIKLNKKQVGNIFSPTKRVHTMAKHEEKYTISLFVEKKDIMQDGNPNCTWRKANLKYKFNTLDEAKTWLNKNIKMLMNIYTFHQMGD